MNFLTDTLYNFLTPVQTTGLQTDVFRSWLGLTFAALSLVAMSVAYPAWRGKKIGSPLYYVIPLILSLAKKQNKVQMGKLLLLRAFEWARTNDRVLGDWVKKLYSGTLSF